MLIVSILSYQIITHKAERCYQAGLNQLRPEDCVRSVVSVTDRTHKSPY